MKKILIASAILAGAALTFPALAQVYSSASTNINASIGAGTSTSDAGMNASAGTTGTSGTPSYGTTGTTGVRAGTTGGVSANGYTRPSGLPNTGASGAADLL